MIEEIAILCERKKLGAMADFAIGLVQEIVGEERACVADNNSLAAAPLQTIEILAQVRMHDEKGHKILMGKEVSRKGGRRKEVLRCDIKSELREIRHDPAPRPAGRVGDEFERKGRFPDLADRVERTGQSPVADINDSVKVDQNTSDHFVFPGSRRRLSSAPPAPALRTNSPIDRAILISYGVSTRPQHSGAT